jgi:hypothetical protein
MVQWLLLDIAVKQRADELSRVGPDRVEMARLHAAGARGEGLRHALASGLVRLGLALDADAGERVTAARQA